MRKIFKCLSPFLLAICLSVLTTVPALAAEQRFSDVPMDTPYFEAVEYPITSGRFPYSNFAPCFSVKISL